MANPRISRSASAAPRSPATVEKRTNNSVSFPICEKIAALVYAIFFYTDKKERFGCQDCNLAYQNASLMAEAAGVSQFYTGFVCSAAGMDRKRKLQKLLGIEGTVHAGIALGTDIISVSAIVPTEVHVWQEKTVGEVSGRFPEHGDS